VSNLDHCPNPRPPRAPLKRFLAVLAIPAAATPAAAEELRLPDPVVPEPKVITEQGPSPVYYRKSPHLVLPTFRTMFGVQIRVPTGNVTGKAAFTLDAYFGGAIRFGRGSPTGLLTELGYSYIGFSEHLASGGIGILHGLGRPPAKSGELQPLGRRRIGLIPHALVGWAHGDLAYGSRTSLLMGYWVYGVELAHQVLFVGPRQIHEIHLTFGGIMPLGEDE